MRRTRAQRQYNVCAKCGRHRDLPLGARVCVACKGTPGANAYCAVCGESILGKEERDTLNYVHTRCMAGTVGNDGIMRFPKPEPITCGLPELHVRRLCGCFD